MDRAKIVCINAESESAEERRSTSTNGVAGIEDVWFDGDAPPAPVPHLVRDLVPRSGLTIIGGQSGAGKTFVSVGLAVALATRTPFFGREITERVGVIYVAAEGGPTISLRVAATKKAISVDEKLPIAVIKNVPDLSDDGARAEFVKKLNLAADKIAQMFSVRVGIIVVDTVAAAFSMKDENASAEINQVCKKASKLGDALGAATILVAHYGKDPTTGIRGSSAYRGASESILGVLGDRDETSGKCSNRRLVHTKSRCGLEGPVGSFELKDVNLCVDEEGRSFGSAYVEVGELASTDNSFAMPSKPSRPPALATRRYIEALEVAILEHGARRRPCGRDMPEVNAVDRDRVREQFDPRWPADGETDAKRAEARRKAFCRGEEDALKRRLIETMEVDGRQLIWLSRNTEKGAA